MMHGQTQIKFTFLTVLQFCSNKFMTVIMAVITGVAICHYKAIDSHGGTRDEGIWTIRNIQFAVWNTPFQSCLP